MQPRSTRYHSRRCRSCCQADDVDAVLRTEAAVEARDERGIDEIGSRRPAKGLIEPGATETSRIGVGVDALQIHIGWRHLHTNSDLWPSWVNQARTHERP
jgi:hypothetical protein